MITNSRMPEPRERPRKMRSPGRVLVRAAPDCPTADRCGVGGEASVVLVDMSIRILRSAEPLTRWGGRLLAAVHRTVRPGPRGGRGNRAALSDQVISGPRWWCEPC